MDFLPSKKFSIGLGLILILVLLFLIFGGNENKKVTIKEESQKETNEIYTKDTDGDGLADWEEKLWNTDINNPDTDGDGTNDKEETESGRNPTLAGPNDEIDMEIKETSTNKNSTEGSTFEELTNTEKVAESLVSQYLFYKNLEGSSLNQNTKDVIVNSILKDIDSELPFKRYTISDLNTLNKNSTDSIKKYGNDVGIIIKNNSSKLDIEGTLLSLKGVIESGDSGKIRELDSTIDSYAEILKESVKVGVPTSAINIHLSFLNSVSQLTEMLINMKGIFEDPVSGLLAINSFQDVVNDLNTAQTLVNSYFIENNIFYNKNENGSYFIGNN